MQLLPPEPDWLLGLSVFIRCDRQEQSCNHQHACQAVGKTTVPETNVYVIQAILIKYSGRTQYWRKKKKKKITEGKTWGAYKSKKAEKTWLTGVDEKKIQILQLYLHRLPSMLFQFYDWGGKMYICRWLSWWCLQRSNGCSFCLYYLQCLLSWSCQIFWALFVSYFSVVQGNCQLEQQLGSTHFRLATLYINMTLGGSAVSFF